MHQLFTGICAAIKRSVYSCFLSIGKVTDSGKHVNLLRYGINYDNKKLYNTDLRGRIQKTFLVCIFVTYEWAQKVFIFGWPFQSSVMIVGKAISIPKRGAHERCSTRVGSGLTLLLNTRPARDKRSILFDPFISFEEKMSQAPHIFFVTQNGPNKFDGYRTLGQKGLQRTNILAYWAHL